VPVARATRCEIVLFILASYEGVVRAAPNGMAAMLEELGDDDIIEVVSMREKSGTFAASGDRPRTDQSDVPMDSEPTMVRSDIVSLLARLSKPGAVPSLTGPLDVNDREPVEAVILRFVAASKNVEAIVEESPLGEESTLRLLAKLAMEGTLKLDA
jgi:hypothetical protein